MYLSGRYLDAAELLALALEELAQLVGEPLDVDRLLDETVRAHREGEAPVAVARQDDDRAAVEALVRPQTGGRLVAVDAGKLDVAEDQVGVGADGQIDAGDPVARLEDVEAARLENAPHQRPALWIVLDVEDPRCGRKGCVGHR
jgi:hypothetical protein